MTVGAVTINGREYRLHYGMSLAEHFTALVVENVDGKIRTKSPTTPQVLTCIIFYGHENWCDIHDEPFTLKRGEVSMFVEDAYLSNNEQAKEQFDKISTEFMESQYIGDLIKAGKKIQEDKKKEETTGPTLSEQLSVSLP